MAGIEERYLKNRPIVKKLFDLPCKEIVEIVKQCLIEVDKYDGELKRFIDSETKCVEKKSTNDECEEIKMCYYDKIEINSWRLSYTQEHSSTSTILFDFATLEKVLDKYLKEKI